MSQIPQEIYHRIYWYAKRNVDSRLIAHALNLPLKTVEHLLEKMSSADHIQPPPEEPSNKENTHQKQPHSQPRPSDFLDVFTFVKTRYTVIDISGMATSANIDKLHAELKKLLASDWKAVALRMTDVKEIDEEGFNAICTFYEAYSKMRRYTAILDPSPKVDSLLALHKLDKKIPVFGTESAFEEKAFGK
jgi:ABC-type transporter Mla MlaB component